MSLWRVRHGLSPVIEYALVALTIVYGLFAIYLASLKPLEVAFVADVRSLPRPVTLDLDAWERSENVAYGYSYAIPPGWIIVSDDGSRVVLARDFKRSWLAGHDGAEGLVIEVLPLGPRQEVQNVAAEEFRGLRPALYDVAVDGRDSLFAVSFDGGRLERQAVYVPAEGRAYVVRGGATDPAVFAVFVSSIAFAPEP